MKSFIFGKYTIGDKIILSHMENSLKNTEYLGEKVDLSRIKAVDKNLIVVINPSLYNIDLDKIVGYLNKDDTKPMVVVKKIRTFGTLFFKPNYEIERITTNKAFLFAGILYLPKKYLDNLPKGKKTVANIFRTVPYKDWGVYIINSKKR